MLAKLFLYVISFLFPHFSHQANGIILAKMLIQSLLGVGGLQWGLEFCKNSIQFLSLSTLSH